MKTALLSSVLVALSWTILDAQNCQVALEQDTFVCGFSYTLTFEPPGGDWGVICAASAGVADFFNINDSLTSVTVSECGDYDLIYTYLDTLVSELIDTISMDPLVLDTLLITDTLCLSTDTISVAFNNPNSADLDLRFSINTRYPESSCIPNDTINCENTFGLQDPEPPLMEWEIITVGLCQTTVLNVDVIDETDCEAESILFQSSSFNSIITDTITVYERYFVQTNPAGEIIANPYQDALSQAITQVIAENEELCPLPEYCNNTPIWCLDTLLDTTLVVLPRRVGGDWLFHDGPDSVIPLADTTEFIRADSTYLIIATPNANAFDAQLEIFQINYAGDTIPDINPGPITLEWEEHWQTDSICQVSFRLVDTCCGGGINIRSEIIDPAEPPVYDCPPFSTIFLEELGYFAAPRNCNDSTYNLRVIIEGGNPPYVITGITGELTDSVFTSDPIPLSQHYEVQVSDQDSCSVEFNGDVCDCVDVKAFAEEEVLYDCVTGCVELSAIGSSGVNEVLAFEWRDADSLVIGNSSTIEVCQPGSYFVEVTGLTSACKARKEVTVVRVQPVADIGPDSVLNCRRPEINLGGPLLTMGESIVYSWSGPGIEMTEQAIAQPQVEVPGVYELVILDTLSHCADTAVLTITENFYAPMADAGEDLRLNCLNSPVYIGGLETSVGDSIGILWTASYPFPQDELRYPLVSTADQYILTVTNNKNGCTARDTMVLSPYDTIRFNLTSFPTCWNRPSGQVLVDGITGGNEPYAFSYNGFVYQPDNLLENLNGNLQTIYVRDRFGCESSQTILVEEIPPIETFEVQEEYHFCGPGELELDLSTSVENDEVFYNWFDGGSEPARILTEPGSYWASYGSSCESYRFEFEIFDDLDTESSFAMPNIFSPNNDGVNDLFKPVTILEIEDYELAVFNRWGKQVFQSFSQEEGWDGTLDGKALPADIYVFILRGRFVFCDGGDDQLSEKGDVTLLR